MTEVHFKSNEFFFEKEREGIKPNTIRELGEHDNRFNELMEMIQTKEYGKIIIHRNTDFETTFFERQITDVSYWNNFFIISWENPKVFKCNVVQCFDDEFHGIECIGKEENGKHYFGFEGCYNDDINSPNPRPAHRIWVKDIEAEKLFKMFREVNEEAIK